MIAAFMVAAVSANAQFEPGTFSIQPKVGGTISWLSNMPSYGDIKKSIYAGALAGAEFEYQVAQPFSLAAGVNFAMQGCQWDDVKIGSKEYKDPKIELTYLNVPVVANIYLFKGFAIKAGVQVGFLLSANYKEEMKEGNTTTKTDMKIKDDCKTVDISIPMGVSYQVPTIPIYIDARYNLGLTNINKDGDYSTKNRVIQLTVGYKFAL